MEKRLISSQLIYHVAPRDDMVNYICEGMKAMKRIGFDAVDFNTALIAGLGDRPEQALEQIKGYMEELNLPFRLCHLPFVPQKMGLPTKEFNQSVYTAIDAAKQLGVDHAVMHPNSATLPLEGYDPQEEYDKVTAYLAPFVEYAHKKGVSIVLENMRTVRKDYPAHRYCANPEELCKVADALGMGICWDTGHAHITGLKQSDALRYIGNRLKMVHLNDNLADDDLHLAPFFGTADWKDIMQGLSAIGFEGILNFELSTGRIPASAREAFGKYVCQAAKELITYI